MQRRLIVNADDFGRSPGINRGIVEAHQHGIVTSTTLMVNLPATADAVRLAGLVPNLGIGLHLNFCYGPPLAADVNSLLGSDGLLDRDLARLRERATPVDLQREADSQLARFRELLGLNPTHLDSHQHVHAWPAAIEPIAALAREVGIPVRAFNADHLAALQALNVRCPDEFIIDFYGHANITPDALTTLLAALSPGTTELMCHPGYDDPFLHDSSYREEREIELRTLCSAEARSSLANVELVSFERL